MISSEAKVGAVTMAAMLLLAFMIFNLGHFSFGEKGYPVQAVFSQVGGLKAGNAVRYAGVDVGQVEGINVNPGGVTVQMKIRKEVKIPENAHFSIGTDGLLGEKFIEIVPPQENSGFLQPGAVVQGDDPRGMDHLIASADKTLSELQTMVGSVNHVIGDPEVQRALKDSALDLSRTMANFNDLSTSLAQMAAHNTGDVDGIVDNLLAMSQTLNQASAHVDRMARDIDNDGQTAADLRQTVFSMRETSQKVAHMATALEPVVTSPKTAQNIQETLENTRQASAKANRILTGLNQIKVDADMEVLYGNHNGKYRSNAALKIANSPREYAILGVNNFGDDSTWDIQTGRIWGDYGGRIGVVNGKAGFGADFFVHDPFQLSFDVYDPNLPRMKLHGQYQVAPDLFLVMTSDDLAHKRDENTYFGMRYNF